MPQAASESSQIPVRPTAPPAPHYDVVVGHGRLGELPALLRERCAAHRYVIITDETVGDLYAEEVQRLAEATGARTDVLRFPPGEQNKTRETWAELTDRMLAAGVGRDSAVIALGGGVTGDLAAFVAATYMRGLPVVQVPTSLLAMIDSSVGGKTGVDTPAGKNLVGAFLQPALVLADPATLSTLATEEVRSGMAEAIKHGAIADAEYFRWIEEHADSLLALDPEALTRLVVRSVEIKAGVVSRDERESGPRKLLNFGHTLGHAVEAVSGYGLLHGQAIAIGMVLEAELGERMGVTAEGTRARLRALLAHVGLPVSLPPRMPPDDVLAATRADKKARAGRVEYALLERIGEARWGSGVGDEEILALLTADG